MNWERRKKLMFRWSLVTAGLIATFWGIWYLVNGSVPVVTSIIMSSERTIELPFAMSRWWDVLNGPLWSTILIFIFTEKRIWKDADLVPELVVVLVIVLTVGLVYGLVVGLVYGLVVGLVVLIKLVFSRNIWQAIANWLIAR